MINLQVTESEDSLRVPLAVVLDGVSDRWGMNVLQVLGQQTSAWVNLDGYGVVKTAAVRLSKEQARHLAAQIIELVGSEG